MQESTGALSVAIVEDDPRIQQLLLAEIQDEGHNAVVYSSAEDFLDNASAQQFDLVLLDVNLPDGDGLEALSSIKNGASEPEVIIITAEGNAEGARMAIDFGAWDYILKPIEDMSVLYHSVKKCLKLRLEQVMILIHLILYRYYPYRTFFVV